MSAFYAANAVVAANLRPGVNPVLDDFTDLESNPNPNPRRGDVGLTVVGAAVTATLKAGGSRQAALQVARDTWEDSLNFES